jgi:hypothetical protein
MRLPLLRQHRRLVAVLTVVAVVAVLNPAAAPSSAAQTAPSTTTTTSIVGATTSTTGPTTTIGPTTTLGATTSTTAGTTTTTVAPAPPVLTGPPAPASFATDLTRIYREATSVVPPPGATPSTASVPKSPDAFATTIAGFSQGQLTQIYDADPSAWPQVISAVDDYAKGVAASAASAPPAPVAPKLAPAAASGTSSPPEIFEANSCPDLAFAASGGAFQERYSLVVAQSAVELAADILDTVAVGLDSVLEDESPSLPEGFLAIVATIAGKQVSDALAAALSTVAAALEIPIDVIDFVLHRAIDSCQYNNSVGVIPVIDANAVGTQTNVDGSYGVGQQNFQLGQAINQLLDQRTQTAINQLDTAQASLDGDLRHSIEVALEGGGNTAIVSYEMPSSLGGYLDATPIGVQAIVTSTLSLMQAAKQQIPGGAANQLVQANKALAAGQYIQAFHMYQNAYQQLVR